MLTFAASQTRKGRIAAPPSRPSKVRVCYAVSVLAFPVVAWALIRLTPWMWTRALGWIYPVLIAVDIVVTGNHYVLDIAGGLAVVLPAAALAAWIVRVRPDVAVAGDPAPPPHPAPRPQPERERTRT